MMDYLFVLVLHSLTSWLIFSNSQGLYISFVHIHAGRLVPIFYAAIFLCASRHRLYMYTKTEVVCIICSIDIDTLSSYVRMCYNRGYNTCTCMFCS